MQMKQMPQELRKQTLDLVNACCACA